MGDSLGELLDSAEAAWRSGDWATLDRLSRRALEVGRLKHLERSTMVDVARRYLGACLGSGEFFSFVSGVPQSVHDGVAWFEDWCRDSGSEDLLADAGCMAIHEIVLLSTDDSLRARCELASALRKVARPHLAITVSNCVLSQSRLNYYALATKGAAFTDLADYDQAIEILGKALQPFHPADGLDRPMNAMSRALRLRGSLTGDMADLQDAADLGGHAYALFPSEFSWRTYRAAANALGDLDTVKLLDAIEEGPVTGTSTLSGTVMARAIEVISRVRSRDGAQDQN